MGLPKTEIVICCGTMCYIMGGANLHLLQEQIPESYSELITIRGDQCLDYCKKQDSGKPPFVLIDGKVMESASIDKIKKHLKTLYHDLF